MKRINRGEKRAWGIGYSVGWFLAGVIVAVAAVALWQSRDGKIPYKPGQYFSIELGDLSEGIKLVPGDSTTATASVRNLGNVGPCHMFVELVYDQNIYSVSPGTGWELITDESGDAVFSYSTGEVMTSVSPGDPADFTATLKVIATDSYFQSLTAEEMAVNVIGHGLDVSLSAQNKNEAWEKFSQVSGR